MASAGDLIVARATADAAAGVGVIRLSGGHGALQDLARSLFGELPLPRQACLRSFRGGTGERLDQGLVLYFAAPASYTGEHVLELHTHGSLPIMAGLIDSCLQAGARLAKPGEFTERAFHNGKLDLLQAEAVADLIAAKDHAAAAAALRVMQGEASQRVAAMEQTLLGLRAEAEARIDFADDLHEAALSPLWHADIQQLSAQLDALCEALDRERHRPTQSRLVLIGPPNAGKSTLFNALLAHDRAIVSPQAGTTRDTLDAELQLGKLAVRLIDTAGLHVSDDALEQEGIRRTYQALAQAEGVLLLESADTRWEPGLHEALNDLAPQAWQLTIITKCDDDAEPAAPLGADASPNQPLRVSAKTGSGLARLRGHLRSLLERTTSPSLGFSSERHLSALREAWLETTEAQKFATVDLVLAAEHLRRALNALTRLTGRDGIDEEMLGLIFGRFCIGK